MSIAAPLADPLIRDSQPTRIQSSLLPELITAAELLSLTALLALAIWTSYQIEFHEYSWWVVFIPVWIATPIIVAVLTYGLFAPAPYLRQLRSIRSLQAGNNPSAIQLIPLMITAVSGVGVVVLVFAFSIALCAYLSSGYAFGIAYAMIPLFVLHLAGIAKAILIVGKSLEQLLAHFAFLLSEILIAIRLDAVGDLSLILVGFPLYCLLLAYLGKLLVQAHTNIKTWDLVEYWRWFFSLCQIIWASVFLGLVTCKLEIFAQSSYWISYTTLFIPLELSISCKIFHESILLYKLIQPSRLNPTSLDTNIQLAPLKLSSHHQNDPEEAQNI
jgi:hypothetical protein